MRASRSDKRVGEANHAWNFIPRLRIKEFPTYNLETRYVEGMTRSFFGYSSIFYTVRLSKQYTDIHSC